MPGYSFRCSSCNRDTVAEYPMGESPRIIKCECGRPSRRVIGEGVYIAAAARPSTKPHVLDAVRRDRRLAADAPAYKRMRNRGLQPNSIDGCAQLEDKVGSQDEIDYSRAIAVAEKVGGGKQRVIEAVESLTPTHGAVA